MEAVKGLTLGGTGGVGGGAGGGRLAARGWHRRPAELGGPI